MTENTFGMMSGWMANGKVNELVKVHRDVNRFELVSPPSKLLKSRLTTYRWQLCGFDSWEISRGANSICTVRE